MNDNTYPATPEEFEEYRAVMSAMADEAEASTPDPTPAPSVFVIEAPDLSLCGLSSPIYSKNNQKSSCDFSAIW